MFKMVRALRGVLTATALLFANPAHADIDVLPTLTASSTKIQSPAPKATNTAPARKWQIAQDVSEKEAFELAKDANSLRVWQAYLYKFPNGFRAEIAKSYIQKLQSGGDQSQPVDGSDNGDDNVAVDYVRASELQGPYRIAARGLDRVYINNTSQGLVTVRPNALDRRSGHWQFEQVRGTPFVRIRNRWKGTYLHIDRGSVQSHARSRRDPVTHWSLERTDDGSGHVVLRHRSTGDYIWTARNDLFLYASPGEPRSPRGFWRLVYMDDNDRYADDDEYEPEQRPTTPRITCTNGYVKNGSCRCRSGRERVKLSRNRYRCNRIKVRTSCGKGMYYSKSRKRCVCKRGYEPGNGRCWRNEELDDRGGNTSCPKGFLLRKGSCVCPRGKKNIQGKCRRPKGGGVVKPKIRCSKIKFAFTRGNTCKCAGGRVFTGRACVLRK